MLETGQGLIAVETKSARTVAPAFFAGLDAFASSSAPAESRARYGGSWSTAVKSASSAVA